MRTAHKSEAMLRFEREIALLEARVGNGHCADPIEEYRRIRGETWPSMTEQERAILQKMELRTHQVGAEILAERGQRYAASSFRLDSRGLENTIYPTQKQQ